MSAPVDQQVVEKIKKLLKVDTDKGHSAAEAEQALMAAQRLAVRHGINLDEVDTSEELIPTEPIVGEDFTPERTGGGLCASRLPTTHKYIAWILEKYFRVSIVWLRRWGKYVDKGIEKEGKIRSLQIFGKKTNVQIAIYVYGFLHREFSIAWREHRRATNSPMSSRASFFFGLYAGLNAKLESTMGQIELETAKKLQSKGTSMALVLVSEKEKVDQAVKGAHPRIKYVSESDIDVSDGDAVYHGTERGAKIEIKTALK